MDPKRMELLRRLMERGGTDDGQADTAMQMVVSSPSMRVIDQGDQPEPVGLAAARGLLRQYSDPSVDGSSVDVRVGEPQVVSRKGVDMRVGEPEVVERKSNVSPADQELAERMTRSRYPAVDVQVGEPRIGVRYHEGDEPNRWQQLASALGLEP